MPTPWRWLRLALLALCAQTALSAQTTETQPAHHEAGRCAMRGQCGAEFLFGKQLPCPDNELAEQPSESMREKLVAVCGAKWEEGTVCCSEEQVDTLRDNLDMVKQLISSCPACKENFYNLFCTFTCSPDQSTFINITDTITSKDGKEAVMELDNLWSDEYKSVFYDSCKDVKFGPTGSSAMAFIGGGAKNYTEFLAFVGKKSPYLGSPFQINFPDADDNAKDGLEAMDPPAHPCNDSDPDYRCVCVDCPASCPELPALTEQGECYVGALPCLSFASVLVYSIIVLLIVVAIVGHVAYRRHARHKSERLQLLQDAAPSDDEDEGDIVHNGGMLDRPQRSYSVNSYYDAAFAKLGSTCARYPTITILISVIAVLVLSLGWVNFEVEKDPVRLWVSPSSDAAQEKEFFDSNFGPFYRAEQVFLVNESSTGETGPVLSYDILRWWFDVESQVARLTSREGHITLDDVCFKPTGKDCVVQSVTGYFGRDIQNLSLKNWARKIEHCAKSPADQECLPPFQQTINKELVLGGIQDQQNVLNATAMITTWVVNNHPQGSKAEATAMKWEAALRDLLKSVRQAAEEKGLRLSFSTEISLEEELNKSSNTDARIVVISYVIMFIYASFALGSSGLSLKNLLNNPALAMVRSKFTLGVCGIIIVLMSVSASVGLFSAANIKVTLIIAEVIPFLVLAIGVDNIFLIVHEFERVNASFPDEPIDFRMSKALGRIGPSILFSALTETIAFVLGVFVGMPAVKNFAAYAAGAVVINALLQITLFVAVLALNQKRVESGRIDCFPCVQLNHHSMPIRGTLITGAEEDEGVLQRFIRTTYAPALLNRQVKVLVVTVFLGFFAAGIALMPEIKLGLDQRIAIPDDSYLIPYFNDLANYFDTGPPVYFVTRDANSSSQATQQQLCGRFLGCNEKALPTVLEQESKRSEVSYITGGTMDWLDDFFYWLNPENDQCCRENGKVCLDGRDPAWNRSLSTMPEGSEFIYYLGKWLDAPSNKECALGGKAPYSSSVVYSPKHTSTPASRFQTYHTPLRTQDDFISAYASARRVASEIRDANDGLDVFPYSKFYIFFDQYATVVGLAATLLGSALALIFILATILLGSLATALVVTLTVAMTLVDIVGTMALAGVALNAVSLVNLVICVGIAVEFCAHLARAFAFPSHAVMESAPARHQFRGRDARAWTALVDVGGRVFAGITVTKLLGVCVLAFTRSKIFEVYYFRVWLALVVWAALHALVFLPVALSLFGGEGYVDPESDGGLEDFAARRYRALLPDDDDEDSDD